MTNNTDKTISRGEYLTMALQHAHLFLDLVLASGTEHYAAVTSVDSRYQRNQVWHPVARAEDVSYSDLIGLAARTMAALTYHHKWAQVLVQSADGDTYCLTWKGSEWQYGDILP